MLESNFEDAHSWVLENAPVMYKPALAAPTVPRCRGMYGGEGKGRIKVQFKCASHVYRYDRCLFYPYKIFSTLSLDLSYSCNFLNLFLILLLLLIVLIIIKFVLWATGSMAVILICFFLLLLLFLEF